MAGQDRNTLSIIENIDAAESYAGPLRKDASSSHLTKRNINES